MKNVNKQDSEIPDERNLNCVTSFLLFKEHPTNLQVGTCKYCFFYKRITKLHITTIRGEVRSNRYTIKEQNKETKY